MHIRIACAVLAITRVASGVGVASDSFIMRPKRVIIIESRKNLSTKVTLLPGFIIRLRIPVRSESSSVLWKHAKESVA